MCVCVCVIGIYVRQSSEKSCDSLECSLCFRCTDVLLIVPCITVSRLVCVILQGDIEKGLEMKKLVLSGFLASEEIYINQLEALLLVRQPTPTPPHTHTHEL